jgi:hypothetical protein
LLPNLVIIGAERCGTTALWRYLTRHPEVYMSRLKEIRFFDGKHWDRGLAWYESHFADASAAVLGEASPQYTFYPRRQGTPQRMHSVVPKAKLIYLVRDPIERLVSSYVDKYAVGIEHGTFAKAVRPSPTNHYVSVSRYAMQLEQYLPYFPLERILVLSQEEFLNQRRRTLGKVFRFLGIGEAYETHPFDRFANPSTRKRRMRWRRLAPMIKPAPTGRLPWRVRAPVKRTLTWPLSVSVERPIVDGSLRQSLAEILGPEADRFRELTGRSFPEWSL